MDEQKTIIDKNGYVTNRNVLFKNGVPQFYILKDGEIAVDLLTITQEVDNNIIPLLKPCWKGSEWVETATDEEIQVWIKENTTTGKAPTTQEQINAQLLEEIAQQKIVNAQLIQEIATLKGGITNV